MAYDKADQPVKVPNYNPTGAEKEARDWVLDRKRQMEQSEERQKAEKMWNKWMKQWDQTRPEENDSWQSNHVVPTTTAVVETVLSEVIDQSPRPLILPRGSEDAPKARIMEHIFGYTWDVSDGDLELYNVLKDAFILGTGIAQEYYWKEARMIYNGKDQEKLVYDFDDCYMEAVRIQDFFVDEKARGFTGPYQARDAIRRYIMSLDDFKLAFKGPVWDEMGNVSKVVAGGEVEYTGNYKPPDGFDKSKDVEIFWYWSRSPKDCLYIVANGVLVVKGPNPYKHKQLPFARAVDVKRTHMFYGKGEAALLESIQDEQTTLRRMIIDRNHLDIDKMFFVSPYLNLSDEDLIARPHGAIPTDDVNAAKAIEYGDIPRSVELSLKHLEDDAVLVTGVNPRAQALPTAGTATEAAIIKESTLKRIRLKVRLLEKEFLTQIARLRVSNILQYYPEPKLEKIVGDSETQTYKAEVDQLRARGLLTQVNGENYKKSYRKIRTKDVRLDLNEQNGQPMEVSAPGYHFFELKPEFYMPVASGGYDIKFEAGATLPVSKALMRSEANEVFDRLSQIALAVPGSYDITKLGDDLLRVNDKNPEDFKTEQQQNTQSRVDVANKLADLENNQMLKGAQVPPTPYAPVSHTQMHVEFTKSSQFQALDPQSPVIDHIVDHIMGEYVAQQTRNEGQPGQTPPQMGGATAPGGTPSAMVPGMGQNPPPGATNGANNQMQAAIPAKVQGGGQVPGQ